MSGPAGAFLCGFGKGKFDRNINGIFNPDCHHMFHLKTCEDMVYTSKMLPVKDVVGEQRSKNPEAKIAYHSMSEIPSKDKLSFGVKQEIEVFFAPAGSSASEGASVSQSRKVLLLGCSRPLCSMAHTVPRRRGRSSGVPLA